MRFAVLEMKISLARLLAEYNISLGSKTQTPLTFDRKAFQLMPKGGIWLKFEKRKAQLNSKLIQ